jgi:pSer/pThr/pTyr-binding forkhead associated (FHA) protein
MNCLKLHLDVPFVTIPNETFPPIPQTSLFKEPYDVVKPSWCGIPNISLHFEEIGTLKSREVGNEPFQLIGRNDRCHIILNDVMVSRCHALLLHTNSGDSYLLDINSSHGTYLGNVRLVPFVPTLIKKGNSVIRFGSSEQRYLLREYPKVDDVLKKSKVCESIEEKEVVLNTFHNIACLSSCTSTIPKSLSKLFGRTPTDQSVHESSIVPQQQQQHQYYQQQQHQYEYRDDEGEFRNSPASSDDLMSVCTSREDSSDNLQEQHQSYQFPTNSKGADGMPPSSSPPFISPRSTVPRNHFLSLSIPLDLNPRVPSPSPRNHSIDIEVTSISSSLTSSSSEGYSHFDFPQQQQPSAHPVVTEEDSIQLRKCLRRSYSVDSDIRPLPQNCLYLAPAVAAAATSSSSSSYGSLNRLNFGRRTCSVDFSTSDGKCTSKNKMSCGRKRVRFSLSEIDLAKHQERINTTLAETNGSVLL